MERSKNEAEAYANDVIPRARGSCKYYKQLKHIKKKLWQQKVKQADSINLCRICKSKRGYSRKNVFRNNGKSVGRY